MIRPPPGSTHFPYTTVSRSGPAGAREVAGGQGRPRDVADAVVLAVAQDVLRPAIREVVAVLHRRHGEELARGLDLLDRKSTRLNSSNANISYAGFCLNKYSH